jgi:hypothetical protein
MRRNHPTADEGAKKYVDAIDGKMRRDKKIHRNLTEKNGFEGPAVKSSTFSIRLFVYQRHRSELSKAQRQEER